jgi:hypothetical protein
VALSIFASATASSTFSDLTGKLATLRVECSKCERKGRYAVTRLIEQHGRDGKLTDWLAHVSRDCSRRKSINMADQCGAEMPDLVGIG